MKNLACFNRYDSKGRRLAIFAREIEDSKLEVFILTCNRKDEFHKKLARAVYQDYVNGTMDTDDWHPTIYFVPIMSGDSLGYTFFRHLKQNFYRLVEEEHVASLFMNIKVVNNRKMGKMGGEGYEIALISKLIKR